MKAIEEMTQIEYTRLENMVARALQTQRRCIRIDSATPLSDGIYNLRVIYRGLFPYRLITDGTTVFKITREVRKA